MHKELTTHAKIADVGKPRIVIIGGGFGGLELVKSLKNKGLQVVLFDKNNHHTFQPLLYQVATSGLETSSILAPFRKLFSSYKDFYFRMAEVKHLSPKENTIETSIGSLRYDYLVIATGANTNFFGMQDVAKHASQMKNIADATKLRNKIIRHMEYSLLADDEVEMNSLIDMVIVGGGPTGVELAGALSELRKHVFPKDYREINLKNMNIHLIERSSRLLIGMSEHASLKAKEFLEKMGVKVHLDCAMKSYDGYEAVFSNGEKLITRSLIWAAGVQGNLPEGLPRENIVRGNRCLTDPFNRVKGYENIFAIGDAACMEGDENFPSGHPMMAPVAQQQGKLLAKNLLKLINKQEAKPFRYADKGSMATIGRNRAVVDLPGKIRFAGAFAWYVWMLVHLMALVGFRRKVFTFFSWAWNFFTYDKSNRLIIGRNEEKMESEWQT